MRIMTKCVNCGDVELTAGAIDLQWCSHAPASFYRFTCPMCGTPVRKPADDRIMQLLISGGVCPVVWHLPKEMLEKHDGPQFTLDDVLDFHSMLERDGWFEELLSLVHKPATGHAA